MKILTKILFLLLIVGCSQKEDPEYKRTIVVCYVDSVWVKKPGEINTLQFDPVYFFRTTEGNIHQSRSEVRVGDSCVYYFHTRK